MLVRKYKKEIVVNEYSFEAKPKVSIGRDELYNVII